MPPHWIDTPERLSLALDRWRGNPLIALDTEFVRERTYYPQLALVQLACAEEVLLIDPCVAGMAEVMRPLLLDPAVTKLMHSASEDLQALSRGCDAVPAPLFDTQVAAALCGLGAGLGYQKLVEQMLGVALDKGETRSDWLRRPLSESQLRYAAEDVLYLHALHARLQARLRELGREAWLQAECERAVAQARDEGLDPYPHLAVRSAQLLDREGQARLCRLLLWREQMARRHDLPRGWLLDPELAVSLCRRVPMDHGDFNGVLARHPKSPRKHRAQLWEALNEPLRAGDLDIPLVRSPEAQDKARLRRLQDAVAATAQAQGLPEGLLCAKRHLEALLEHATWPEALQGWRRPLLEPALMPLLEQA